MDFSADKPIFRQIVDLCHSRILAGEWIPGCKVPSVRELAVEFAVNTRTVLNGFEVLEKEGVIESSRGLGYFLTNDAKERVYASKRQSFFSTTVPRFFAEMDQLGITIADIVENYNSYKK